MDEAGRLRELLDHNTDWVWEVDANGRYTYASEMVQCLLGYAPEAVIGKTPFHFMPPAEAQRVGDAFGAIVAAQRSFSGLINRNVHIDGHIVVLETSGIPLFDEAGQLRGYRGIDRDVSALGERMLQLEAVHLHAPVALCTVDCQGQFVMTNLAMARLLGMSASDIDNATLCALMPDLWERLQLDIAHAQVDAALPDHEVAWRNGCWLQATPHALRSASGGVVGLSIAWIDITARKQAEDHLTQANRLLAAHARQDYLTGLYNRRYLDEQLAIEVARARRDAQSLSVCMVDVDYFKLYNDSLGHHAGDCCLRSLAGVMKECARRPSDIVSRFGGEEFAIVLPGTGAQGAMAVADAIRLKVQQLALEHPASALGRVSVSIGVVTREAQKTSASSASIPDEQLACDLLRHADKAMYAAKHAGRDRIVCAPPLVDGYD
ncbi:sensor domain-containing diguanylate cyclase [Diaphorobacter sp.]|uniref:sensor domain-containing diguanylate cyclase n=1 Tax=Diaphorobacter sp. TaxID=1934310 RepID=UPI0028A71130|nr:sensor domain-containing diguanylate cyclase [Diaphorobacter sp.]